MLEPRVLFAQVLTLRYRLSEFSLQSVIALHASTPVEFGLSLRNPGWLTAVLNHVLSSLLRCCCGEQPPYNSIDCDMLDTAY